MAQKFETQMVIPMTDAMARQVRMAAATAGMEQTNYVRSSVAVQLGNSGHEAPPVSRSAEDMDREHLILNCAEARNRRPQAEQLAWFSNKSASACIRELADMDSADNAKGSEIAQTFAAHQRAVRRR